MGIPKNHTPTLDDKIPNGIAEEQKEKLKQQIKSNSNNTVSKKPIKGKVCQNMCETMKQMSQEGMTYGEIIDCMPVSSRSAVSYHVTNKCEHDQTLSITYSQCGWMRTKAHMGLSIFEITKDIGYSDRTYKSMRERVRYHVTGECSHEEGVKPLDQNQTNKDKNNDVDQVEGIFDIDE
jgi:hypothetical protein